MADEARPSAMALPLSVRSGATAGHRTEGGALPQVRPRPLSDAEAEGEMAAAIEALRSCGAAHFDAVGFCVIDAMWRRCENLQGAARAAVRRKLARRLAALRERFEREGGGNRVAAGEQAERRSCSPLAALLAHAARHSGAGAAAPANALATSGGPAGELKSLRYFGSTWSRLSLEQQLSQALAQAPDNAGPLNSQFLVLQALIRMRDIAPQYLENFMSYTDALLWLDLADSGKAPGHKPAARKARRRKPKAG